MMEKLFHIRVKHFCPGRVAVLGTALGFIAPIVPAHAQWTVYDGASHVQTVLIVARELQQSDNQITSFANQAQMLVNQAKNLVLLPLATLSSLQSKLYLSTALLAQA